MLFRSKYKIGKANQLKIENLKGVLHKYKNTDLIQAEEKAWEEAVVDKYKEKTKDRT